MNYRKLASKYLDQKSNNSAHVAVALVAGLAAGAVISILFAPDRGDNTRQNIANRAKSMGNSIKDSCESLFACFCTSSTATVEDTNNEVPHFKHKVTKKKKSDIDDIIAEHRADEKNTDEQA